MRDVVVLVIILGTGLFCMFYPHLGILIQTWVAYFNLRRFSFGAASSFPAFGPPSALVADNNDLGWLWT